MTNFTGRVVVTTALLMICIAGCSKHDDSGSGNPLQPGPPHLRLNFHGYTFNSMSGIWVGVSNFDGREPLFAREILANGIADLGIFPERVSLTIGFVQQPYGIIARSYLDVTSQAEYAFTRCVPDSDLGMAAITVNFPAGQYADLAFVWPSGTFDYGWVHDSSAIRTFVQVRTVEDNAVFSAYARINNADTRLCGWIVGQSYRLHNRYDNIYQFTLDQTLPVQRLTTTGPLDYLSLYAYRGATCAPMLLSTPVAVGSDGQTYDVEFPAFPATAIALSGGVDRDPESYSIWQREDTAPTALTVPEASISATYDAETQTYRQVAVTGPADVLRASWHAEDFFYIVDWTVTCSPQATSISLPTVPDSVIEQMPFFSLSEMQPESLAIDDYEPAADYTTAVHLELAPTGPPESFLTRHFHYRTTAVQ